MSDPKLQRAARALLAELAAYTLAADLGLPHGFIQTDPETGAREIYGPYEDAPAAARAAQAWAAWHEEKTGPPPMQFSLAIWGGAALPPEAEEREKES